MFLFDFTALQVGPLVSSLNLFPLLHPFCMSRGPVVHLDFPVVPTCSLNLPNPCVLHGQEFLYVDCLLKFIHCPEVSEYLATILTSSSYEGWNWGCFFCIAVNNGGVWGFCFCLEIVEIIYPILKILSDFLELLDGIFPKIVGEKNLGPLNFLFQMMEYQKLVKCLFSWKGVWVLPLSNFFPLASISIAQY